MWAIIGNIEIEMSLTQANSASHSGQCDDDVELLLLDPSIMGQLESISNDELKKALNECGCWNEEELNNRDENEARLIWLAANNISEENL